MSIETRAIPPEPRWKGDAIEDTPDGAMISRSTDSSPIGTKFQADDIIGSINGHSTPNVATLTQVLETNLAGYCTGDLISVVLRRKGACISLLAPLPPATGLPPITGTLRQDWLKDNHDTPRRSGFAAVFDADIELLQPEVGCPVIDVEGHIRGMAIISRGRNRTQRSSTSVLPSHVVRRVTMQLIAEAISK